MKEEGDGSLRVIVHFSEPIVPEVFFTNPTYVILETAKHYCFREFLPNIEQLDLDYYFE